MKKFGFVIAIVTALVLIGCATGGGGGGAAAGSGDEFNVDLSTLAFVRNEAPLAARWADHFIPFPEFPVDVTQFQRLTVKALYFDEDGEEITQGDGNVMVTLIYDPDGDWRGPEMGPGPNTPVKEFNVGGFSGMVSTDRGTRIRLNRAPGGILFQNANAAVRYIEVTEIKFHNG